MGFGNADIDDYAGNLLGVFSQNVDGSDTLGLHDWTEVGSPSHSAGKLGNALSLDGSTQYQTQAHNDWTTAAGTVNIWFNSDNISVDQKALFVMTYATTGYLATEIGLTSTNPYLEIRTGTANVRGSTILTSGWHMATFISTGSAWKIYLDGSLETINIIAGSNSGDWWDDFGSSTRTWAIGTLLFAGTRYNYWAGLIDQTCLWDVEVDADGVTALWNGGDGRRWTAAGGTYNPNRFGGYFGGGIGIGGR